MKMQPKIARDEPDIQSLLSTLEGWVNPFQSQGQDLICLSTGKVGERAYRKFSEERLEANSPKVRFNNTMSKAKLKPFRVSGASKRNRQRDCT